MRPACCSASAQQARSPASGSRAWRGLTGDHMLQCRRGLSMRIICMIALALVVSVPAWVRVVDAQNNPTTTGTPLPAASAATPVVAEQADRLLKQMSDYIGSADQFTFHADISFDHVLPSGQKLQY